MKLLCDEGVDRPVVEALRSSGHDVGYVAESSPGISDTEVLELANNTGSVLVTLDKDFGELVFRQRRAMHGVILLRLEGLTSAEKQRTVVAAIHGHGEEVTGSFAVVTPGAVRIRKLQ